MNQKLGGLAGAACGMLQGSATDTRKVATPDQEVWVQNTVLAAIKMALAMQKVQQVRAEDHLVGYGFRGIAEGAAREIIETLGLRPEFVNIRNISKP